MSSFICVLNQNTFKTCLTWVDWARGTPYIFTARALVSCRCLPLSSNVRPHKVASWRTTLWNSRLAHRNRSLRHPPIRGAGKPGGTFVDNLAARDEPWCRLLGRLSRCPNRPAGASFDVTSRGKRAVRASLSIHNRPTAEYDGPTAARLPRWSM
jgi:hypothetical protein